MKSRDSMKRARVIYNPSSGREVMKRNLPYVLNRLEQAGYEASAHMTQKEGCATQAARIAVERKYDVVIAAGGDGTLYEVVNGLAEQEFRPKLGILPTGTMNDFASALGIPKNIKKACDIICNGNTRAVDIGKVNS